MVPVKSCLHDRSMATVITRWLSAWLGCVGLWTVALAGRLWIGPVFWVRFVWKTGLIGAAALLLGLGGVSVVYGVRRIAERDAR